MNKRTNDSGAGMIVLFLLGIVALPVVGLYFIFKQEDPQPVLGTVLVILGILLWAWISMN
ncbi:MAG: hypothetical protein IJX71_04230 [Oscillospiraceae bacterium]|nr:hypothetical protein [Oscillospiraceae bacterium]